MPRSVSRSKPTILSTATSAIEDKVFWFDVAMEDAVVVEVLEADDNTSDEEP